MQRITLSQKISVFCKPFFQSFDMHNHGVISKSQFIQCLDKFITLTVPEAEELASMYQVTDDQVDYGALLKDIGTYQYMICFTRD